MRGRRILIHLGAHRTGTTYLQTVFDDNREALAAHNIHYVSLHDRPSVRLSLLRARHALRDGQPETFEREFAVVADFLSGHLKDHPEKDLLISYEGFLGDLSLIRSRKLYQLHADLLDKLMAIFAGENVHAAFAVREQGAFVESGYKFMAQVGAKSGFRQYIQRLDENGMSWLPIVGNLKETCGPELSLWTYEDFAKSPRSLVDWLFKRAFGIGAEFLTFREEPRNASVSGKALPLLLAFNRIVRRPRPASNTVYELLVRRLPASKYGRPVLYDQPTRQRLRRRYADDLERIRAEVPDFYRLAEPASVAGEMPPSTGA